MFHYENAQKKFFCDSQEEIQLIQNLHTLAYQKIAYCSVHPAIFQCIAYTTILNYEKRKLSFLQDINIQDKLLLLRFNIRQASAPTYNEMTQQKYKMAESKFNENLYINEVFDPTCVYLSETNKYCIPTSLSSSGYREITQQQVKLYNTWKLYSSKIPSENVRARRVKSEDFYHSTISFDPEKRQATQILMAGSKPSQKPQKSIEDRQILIMDSQLLQISAKNEQKIQKKMKTEMNQSIQLIDKAQLSKSQSQWSLDTIIQNYDLAKKKKKINSRQKIAATKAEAQQLKNQTIKVISSSKKNKPKQPEKNSFLKKDKFSSAKADLIEEQRKDSQKWSNIVKSKDLMIAQYEQEIAKLKKEKKHLQDQNLSLKNENKQLKLQVHQQKYKNLQNNQRFKKIKESIFNQLDSFRPLE